jgi:hypothetical protein
LHEQLTHAPSLLECADKLFVEVRHKVKFVAFFLELSIPVATEGLVRLFLLFFFVDGDVLVDFHVNYVF